MITLITGIPGAGKSLYALTLVNKLSNDDKRKVFYHGIPDLTLPWELMEKGEDWTETPKGSIIVIDECQTTFRPRPNGSAVPFHVAALEIHRHQGKDIFLITQHPQLIDANVRKLVGKHFHVVRSFGFGHATVHEFFECQSDPSKNKKNSIKHQFKYPKEVFTWYKSAEAHTVKSKLPAKIWFLLASPFIIGTMAFFTIKSLKSYSEPPVLPTPEITQTNPSKQQHLDDLTFIEAHTPEINGLAYTAPIYREVTKPVNVPYPAACVKFKTKPCACYSDQATKLNVTPEICINIVKYGFYIEWEKKLPNSRDATNSENGSENGVSGRSPDGDITISPNSVGITSRSSPLGS